MCIRDRGYGDDGDESQSSSDEADRDKDRKKKKGLTRDYLDTVKKMPLLASPRELWQPLFKHRVCISATRIQSTRMRDAVALRDGTNAFSQSCDYAREAYDR